jgi:hypothetical protein
MKKGPSKYGRKGAAVGQDTQEPTAEQIDLLRYVVSFVEQNGYQPSYREIADHFIVSPSLVKLWVKALAGFGLVTTRQRDRGRALGLPGLPFQAVVVPEDGRAGGA